MRFVTVVLQKQAECKSCLYIIKFDSKLLILCVGTIDNYDMHIDIKNNELNSNFKLKRSKIANITDVFLNDFKA